MSNEAQQVILDNVFALRGQSAYEIAVENGFVGTEQEWNDSVNANRVAAEAAAANASTSEANASTSEANASTSEANASTSEANAAASEASASDSEDTASTAANSASTDANTASAAASAAQISETNAAASESTATDAANSASSSASTATDAANTATTKAAEAVVSADAASASAASIDTFTAYSIPELQQANPAIQGQAAYLSVYGRSGVFEWQSGDQSNNVNRDPFQGVFVAPISDPTGASGAWKRAFEGAVNPDWFGAVGDYNFNSQTGTDNYAILLDVFNKYAAIEFSGGTGGNYAITDELNISNASGSRQIRSTTSNNKIAIWRHPDFNVGAAGSKAMIHLTSAHNYLDGLMIVPERSFSGLTRDVDGIKTSGGNYGNHFNRIRVLGGRYMYWISNQFDLETRLTDCQGSGGQFGLINDGLDTQFQNLLLQDITRDGLVANRGIEGWNLHIIRTDENGLVINGGDPVIIFGYYMDTIEQDGLVIENVGGCTIQGIYCLKNGKNSEPGDTPASIRLINSSNNMLAGGKTDVNPEDEHAFSLAIEGNSTLNNFTSLSILNVNDEILAQKQRWNSCTGSAGIKFNNSNGISRIVPSMAVNTPTNVSFGVPSSSFEGTAQIGNGPWLLTLKIASRFSTTSSGSFIVGINLSSAAGLNSVGIVKLFGDETRHSFTITNVTYVDRVLSFDITNTASAGNAAAYVVQLERPVDFY